MTNRFTKFLLLGASPAMILLAQSLPAAAQSTATQAVETIETVTVTAERGDFGIMKPVTVPKERSTITQDYLQTQMSGQTIFESLNTVPGLNFTNADPYGNSGGNIRLHGFDGARISFTWDGMPLNDTGNYALYTNQVADSEILSTVTVNQGTTDVDSPTASAVGGVISILTQRPKDDLTFQSDLTVGSFNQLRGFGRVDSGEFGPWNTKAFATYSYDHYDKFKGPGYLQKRQLNGELYQDMGDLGWMSLAVHFNQNRNNFYLAPTFYPANATVAWSGTGAAIAPYGVSGPNIALAPNGSYTGVGALPSPTVAAGYGLTYDEAPVCSRPTPTAGTTQLEATSSGGTTSICTGYYNLRINPSDTGNIRMASLWHLGDSLSLTFDPSLQYVLANGGGVTVLNETDPRLRGVGTAAGKDLNGDGDTLDQISVYSPSNTNTIRYGLNTSLLWQVDEQNTLQFAYTLDYGLHRQTGQMAYLDPNGNPYNPFGGYKDIGHRVLSADGTPIRSRDRRSHAILNQAAVDYEGSFLDDMVHVSAGIRDPLLERDLNQLCYVQASGSFSQTTPGANFQYCTTQTPSTAPAANGTVQFAQLGATNLFTAPGKKVVKYNKMLPSLGLSYSPWGKSHQFFASFAAGLSSPRTDSLYNGGNNGHCQTATTAGCVYSSFAAVAPETTNTYDLGYRYLSDLIDVTVTAYNSQFKNRIVTTFDADQGISVDHNIGSVNMDGIDVATNLRPFDGFSVYTSASWEHTRVAAGPLSTINLNATGTVFVSIANKELVETPDWTVDQRYQYKVAGFTFGLGGKYVGRRFATDANDFRVPSYVTVNADIAYDLGQLGWEGSYIKVNGANLFNERYFGSVTTTRTCFTPTVPTTSGCTSYPAFNVGSPQTFEVTLQSVF